MHATHTAPFPLHADSTTTTKSASTGGANPAVLSFGCGVQSTAMLVLVATGRLPRPNAVVFSDTGSEQPATYDYLATTIGPYLRAHDIVLTILGEDARPASYYGSLEEYCLRYRMVPSTMSRWCTDKFKVRPMGKWLRAQFPGRQVDKWMGISTDESRRAKVIDTKYERARYPLIELGLSRIDCTNIIAAAGLPVPVKSGCWFCPFQRKGQWQALKRNDPELFARALEMERTAKPHANGKRRYLPIFGPLEAIAGQDELPGFDEAMDAEAGCVVGVCHV